MILIDSALERRAEEGNPVRVAIVGAGYIGRGIALQIIDTIPGMHVVAIANRTVETAEKAYRQAGVEEVVRVQSSRELEREVERGRFAVAEDPAVVCGAGNVEVVIEATGEVQFGASTVLEAIRHGKHVVVMNSELDSLLGPILKVRADRAGVVYTNADGDQPGVVMNLFRFVRTIGYRPILVGNMKGMLDPYRNPETQRAFADAHLQGVKMITSFADGTKLSMEQAVAANATGFGVARRGMLGPRCDHVSEAVDAFPLDRLLEGGIVDYILGAEPGPGVFVLGYNDDPAKQQYMHTFKMGEGPVYAFYTPYHLPHLEAPLTAARAVLFGDAAVAPLGRPICEVIAVAKRDLDRGEVLDGIGGFDCYGVIDDSHSARGEGLLPMSLSEGCRLLRPLRKSEPIAMDDVAVPTGRIADELWTEQDERFSERPVHQAGSGR